MSEEELVRYESFLALCEHVGSDDSLSREAKTKEVKAALEDVVARGLVIPERACAPTVGGYARHPLLVVPGVVSVYSMVWAPGQKTPIHDHGDLWCVECVLNGEIEVDSFEAESPEIANTKGGTVPFTFRTNAKAAKGDAGALIPPYDHHTLACFGDDTTWR